MKIAIESNDGVTIKSPFLPTKGYVVYDIKESDIVGSEYRESSLKKGNVVGQKETFSEKSQSLINDCSAIISRGMDRSNVDIYKKEGLDVFITFKTSTKDAVRLYMRELLISSRLAH
jgi:predicted Fe-Mo cluster-binding NifX family protein